MTFDLTRFAPFGRASKVLRPTGKAGSASAVSFSLPAASSAGYAGVRSRRHHILESVHG